MNEFEIISRFFNRPDPHRPDVKLGIGDDCALLQVPTGKLLAASTDTLIENTHFFTTTSAEAIGYRSLAVSLSDLAAMGAEPAWVMLSLSISDANENWLNGFTKGFFELIDQYSMQLVGGNLSKGPLTITTQVFGFVDGLAMQRNGAKAGDKIYVTGTLGDAGLALQALKGQIKVDDKTFAYLKARYERPTPRIKEGLLIKSLATSAIDISDGLIADLGHVLEQTKVGATLYAQALPLSASLQNYLPLHEAWNLALSAGDDYELCFTVPANKELELKQLIEQHNIDCTCIGQIDETLGLRVLNAQQQALNFKHHGYQHFGENND